MHIKEYRIPLPLTVEEYRIAQLYMIQKKSRDESTGAGSGVEIIRNEPYTDGPGGNGQYTLKIYHIGSHIPSWFRSVLPKSALRVEEEAWNAYPYTKTIFRCPFIEKFSITIETVYHQDPGTQENVFGLSSRELEGRDVDVLDFVKDSLPNGDYNKDEDPKLYKSLTTGRGPLSTEWLKERVVKGSEGTPVMCAYKLCAVEFKYWGMQTKIEKFIHDIALRKTMVRAHRQAWAWQDEWHGLTIDDIRNLEAETQKALAERMTDIHIDDALSSQQVKREPDMQSSVPASQNENGNARLSANGDSSQKQWEKSKLTLHALGAKGSQSGISWTSFEQINKEDSDDEFFDAKDEFEEHNNTLRVHEEPMARASSMEMINDEMLERDECSSAGSVFDSPYKKNRLRTKDLDDMENGNRIAVLFIVIHGGNALLVESDKTSKTGDLATLKATFEKVIHLHYSHFAGKYSIKVVSCPAIHSDALNLLASINPYGQEASEVGGNIYNEYFPISAVPLLASKSAEYQDAVVTVANRTNKVYRDFLLSDEGQGFNGQVVLIGDCMGSVMAFDVLCSHPKETTFHLDANGSYKDNKKYASDTELNEPPSRAEPEDFSALPQIRPRRRIGVLGKAQTLDEHQTRRALAKGCKPTLRITLSGPSPGASMPGSRLAGMSLPPGQVPPQQTLRSPASSALLSQQSPNIDTRWFEFDVSDFFMFGSPLALVLAHRIIQHGPDSQPKPGCFQVYNMYYSSDPCAGRLEPLLETGFGQIETVKVPRYQKFPLGDCRSTSLFDCLQRHGLFTEPPSSPRSLVRQGSNASYLSTTSADLNLESITSVARKWWGSKRLDYAMYCPEALQHFPTNALPHLFHASFWESMDAVSFILRQLLMHDSNSELEPTADSQNFQPLQPREKWINRKTAIKTKNITPNHRGNDVIVKEDAPQVITARFMYGPIDMVTLSNEKVDVHIITEPSTHQWQYMGTCNTDKYGRINYRIPDNRMMPLGLYPVKMVVRGDHTFTDLSLLVLPPNTGVAVFSIDGSFTASVSIMGKDPKVRPGAVDVVRHWQDLGYCILYISARPDMQLHKVVRWMAQHNFPHGMVAFMDGVSADPLRQKTQYLKNLIKQTTIEIVAAYGSHKDISVYQSNNVTPDKIYVVGKVPKKAHNQAQVLSEGYAAHLQNLQLSSKVAPSTGNARLFLQKSSFMLPGQKTKKATLQKTATLGGGGDKIPAISVNNYGTTSVDSGVEGGYSNSAKVRGRSPRLMYTRNTEESY